MAISQIPAQMATNALQAIPFSSMIGGPLKACIEAQAMAAQTSWDFIQKVGLNTDPKTGECQAVNVSFSFNQGGRMMQINVPLLTIVPIPYIAINSVDINFKANVSASSSSFSENTQSSSVEAGGTGKATLNLFLFKLEADLKANYSSKKDSKATEESKYSVESTIDVAVKAGQESMPAGLAKVLEMLSNAMDVSDAKGTLEASALVLDSGDTLILTYKDRNGLFAPKEIVCTAGNATTKVADDNVVCEKMTAGKYTFKAGDREVTVEVKEKKADKGEKNVPAAKEEK